MKILIMTQWFEPEPTFKGLLFAKELQKNGHDVEVVTGFPNYPGGKLYDGYRLSLYKKEVIENVTVHRSYLYPSHDQSAIKRIINYLSFGFFSFIIGLIKTRNVDIIYSYHPPLTTSLSAGLLGLFKRVPVVIDIQDLWPDTLAATGMLNNQIALNVVNVICNITYKLANKIVVLSPGFKKKLIERGVPAEKIKVIYNWCNEPALESFCNSEVSLPQNGNLNILFAGNLGHAQDLPSIIEAAKLSEIDSVKVNYVFLGDGVAKAKAKRQVEEYGLKNVFFLPRVSMNEVGGLLNSADILLVHLKDEELFRITIPSRTQANLAIGKPMIMAVTGDAADLALKSGGAIACSPGNPKELSNVVKEMSKLTDCELEQMGQNSKSFYYENLSVKQGVKKFLDLFERLT